MRFMQHRKIDRYLQNASSFMRRQMNGKIFKDHFKAYIQRQKPSLSSYSSKISAVFFHKKNVRYAIWYIILYGITA